MALWVVALIYMTGMALVVMETLLPGMVLGFVGLGGVVISVVYGFEHHWVVGVGQIVIAVVAIPAIFYVAIKKLSVKTDLSVEAGGVSFGKDYSVYLGREGEALTDLRPGGIVLIDRLKVDVVTAGEQVNKGVRVRVVKVEGNRVIVREI